MSEPSPSRSDDGMAAVEPRLSSAPAPSWQNDASGCSVLLPLIVLILGIYTSLGLQIYAMFRKPQPLEQARVQLAILHRLQESQEQGRQLIAEGKHLEAGLLFADLAAAYRLLLPELDKPVAVKPTMLEEEALWEFRRAGCDFGYGEYLKLRYPQWSPK